MRRGLVVLPLVLVTTAATAAVAVSGSASATPAPIPSSHARWATATARVGAADGSARRTVQVFLRMRDAASARAVAASVSDPHNPAYRHYLTPAQIRSRFAPTPATVASIERWLRSAGLQVGAVPANNAYVPATGTTTQIEHTFAVRLNRYRVRHQVLVGADRSATVPAAVAGSVLSVSGLNDTRSRPAAVAPAPGFRNSPPCSGYSGQKIDTTDPAYQGKQYPYAPCGYKPGQLRSAYQLDNVLAHGVDGSGVTVAIVDAFGSPTILNDASTYALRNDPAHPLTAAQYSETVAPPTPGTEDPSFCGAAGWYGEQTLDVEAVHAAAPGANIHYYGAPDCQDASLDATINTIVATDSANIVSNSYGDLGEDVPDAEFAAFDTIAMQAAMEGIGLYFSSGDAGDEEANLGYPSPDFSASSPWVTAVGGTSVEIGKDGSLIGQTGWETAKSTLSSGTWGPAGYTSGAGGGTSRHYDEPDYQKGTVPDELAMKNRTGTDRGRVVPDIASIADPNTGFLVGQTQTFSDGVYYDQYRIGGTSLAAPVVAGTMALADALDGVDHGFVNPSLYGVTNVDGGLDDVLPDTGDGVVRVDYANSEDATDGLITSFRQFDYESLAIHTNTGYDDVTGLGTLHAPVALALDSLAVTPANPTVAAGTSQTFTTSATDGFGATTDQSAHATLSISPNGGTTGAQCAASACSATKTGTYTVTATYSGAAPTRNNATLSGSTTLTVTAASAANLAASGGTPQTATAGSTFVDPLQATVTDSYGNPVSGATVAFALPSSPDAASFPADTHTANAVTDSQGVATSPAITAGPATGSVDATATLGANTVHYALTVTPVTADLAVAISAPAQAYSGRRTTITVRVTNHGPQTAAQVGTRIAVPSDWQVVSSPGSTGRSGDVLTYSAATLAAHTSLSYSVVLVAGSRHYSYHSYGTFAASTASRAADPDHGNNLVRKVVQLR